MKMDGNLILDDAPTLIDVDIVLEPPAVRTWFEAATASGALRLSVDGAPRHAADAAIALARCEVLLDALDACGQALPWRWIADPTPATAATHAIAAWTPAGVAAADSDSAVQIEMPWGWLRALSALPPPLAGHLQWTETPVVLAVSQVPLDADELALLEPGGAVVLPESLQPSWHGWLRALDEPAEPGGGVPIAIESPARVRRLKVGTTQGAVAGDSEGSIWCEIRLASRHPVAAERLAGWCEDPIGDLSPRASLWRCASGDEPARPLAGGCLMPWGDGWALALEVLCDHEVHGSAKAA